MRRRLRTCSSRREPLARSAHKRHFNLCALRLPLPTTARAGTALSKGAAYPSNAFSSQIAPRGKRR